MDRCDGGKRMYFACPDSPVFGKNLPATATRTYRKKPVEIEFEEYDLLRSRSREDRRCTWELITDAPMEENT